MMRFNTLSNEVQRRHSDFISPRRTQLSRLVQDIQLGSSPCESDISLSLSEDEDEDIMVQLGDSIQKRAQPGIPVMQKTETKSDQRFLTSGDPMGISKSGASKCFHESGRVQRLLPTKMNKTDSKTIKTEMKVDQPVLSRAATPKKRGYKKRAYRLPSKTVDDVFSAKMIKKYDVGLLRKGDSMLLAQKRVPKCIHDINGNARNNGNAMWP